MILSSEYRQKLNDLQEQLDFCRDALKLNSLEEELKQLNEELQKEEVWSDIEKTKKYNQRIRVIENTTDEYKRIFGIAEEVEALIDLGEEAKDESLTEEVETKLALCESEIDKLELRTLLRGDYDSNNAILTLHSGAGGTEACDWTGMLYRMYKMYCDKVGYKITELDYLEGDEAGIKSVTFIVEGENAYGYLKAEKGVHRLVRISPFDSNARRHTSFASLEVMPEIENDDSIEIKAEELRIDTYRASGAGGQHVNKTESAVRITHIPTGIVVACQNERSQIQNRETCYKMLRSKLIEVKEREQFEKIQSIKGKIKRIEWGSQIRSYVFQPYTLVKDHRTNYEDGNIQAVMNGDIDEFISEYLKKS